MWKLKVFRKIRNQIKKSKVFSNQSDQKRKEQYFHPQTKSKIKQSKITINKKLLKSKHRLNQIKKKKLINSIIMRLQWNKKQISFQSNKRDKTLESFQLVRY